VVHGLPGQRKIKAGDLVSLDLGFYFQGFHTDMATTIQIPGGTSQSPFLLAGKKALKKAISEAKPGKRVGHLSAAIEKEITKAGLFPVRQLTGHGIGRKLHEKPPIPCFLKGSVSKTPQLESGMSLAIEVIYTQKPGKLVLASDGWTVKAENGKISGLFEKTVAITQSDPLVLT